MSSSSKEAIKFFLEKVRGILHSRSRSKWYGLFETCHGYSAATFESKRFAHCNTIPLETYYLAIVVSQRHIRYILVHSSKHLVYFFPCKAC